MVALPATARTEEGDFDTQGFVALGLNDSDATRSWLDSGLGRYIDDPKRDAALNAQVKLGWHPSPLWDLALHGRADSRGRGDLQHFGIVEATITRHIFLSDDARLSLRAGQMFLPTTQEAVDSLWQSRYTLTLSSLNSWIAEEIRPIGLDVSWRPVDDGEHETEIGALVFGGNDSAGSLLAWRGFALHDRLAVLGESVPLPALPSLRDDNQFGGQRDDGTRPLGRDLDGRPGYGLHARWGKNDRFRFSGSWLDTRGDRELHRGEYAWRTRFALIGATWQPLPTWTFASEWSSGQTGMGDRAAAAFVDIDFDTAYLLSSWTPNERWRLSLRLDRFRIRDRDHSMAENGDDQGDAVTLAAFWTPDVHWRWGLEYLVADTDHAAASDLDLPLDTGGDSIRFEWRYRF